ncbi:MAG: FkbM family methyltransferase [Terracidiphilus sp.]
MIGIGSGLRTRPTVAKIVSRLKLCKLKYSGALPQISWLETGSMLFQPNRNWPTHKLADPRTASGKSVRFETPLGPIYWDSRNRPFLGLLVLEQLCEPYENGSVGIHNGDIVLDLGAHVGTFTRFALRRGAARVIAVEAEPTHAELLRQTFAKEIKEGVVTVVASAVWRNEDGVHFHSDGVGSKISDSGSLCVPTITVDKIVTQLGLERVDFIKADIEGAERHAIVGAAKTIERFAPRMAFCIYHFVDDPRVIPETVMSIRPYQVTMNVAHEQAYFQPPVDTRVVQ